MKYLYKRSSCNADLADFDQCNVEIVTPTICTEMIIKGKSNISSTKGI